MAHPAVHHPSGCLAIFVTDEGRFVETNLGPKDAARGFKSLERKPRYAELRVSRALEDLPFSRDGSGGEGHFGTGLGLWCHCLAEGLRRHSWAEAAHVIRECCG
jgi:hypothetical protein